MLQTSKHTYLRTYEISGQVLRFRLAAEDARLRAQAAASKAGRAGKTLVKEGPLRITQVALQEGTPLQAHAPGGGCRQSVRAARRLRLTTAGGALDLGAGELIVLDAGVAHAAMALSDCAILITDGDAVINPLVPGVADGRSQGRGG
jgi:quercetin dioxygenase-like cupin family protein